MAEHHYVDPKDQHEAATGIDDHSDLTVFYAAKKEEVLGPWMQEDDRQEALQERRNQLVRDLRKSAVLIGIYISLPVVVGILLGQFFMVHASLENAIPLLFLIIFGVGGFLLLSFVLFTWVAKTFRNHNLRALPITLTTLLSLALVIQKIFDLFEGLIGGLVGYSVALIALIFASIIIAVITVQVWTSSKLPSVAKPLVLLLVIIVSAAVFYLA